MAIEYVERCPAAEPLLALFETTGWNDEYGVSGSELAEAFGRSWYVVAAYLEGALVGCGRVLSDGVLYALIVDVIVRPDHQGAGIGREIMARILDRCAAAHVRDVKLFCAQGKAGFYTRLGFVPRPEDGPGMERKQTFE